jgi:hypothetical protein
MHLEIYQPFTQASYIDNLFTTRYISHWKSNTSIPDRFRCEVVKRGIVLAPHCARSMMPWSKFGDTKLIASPTLQG